MRAIYYPHTFKSELRFDGDVAHHLLKVVRLQKDEKILLLNGQGKKATALVVEITKKDLTVRLEATEVVSPQHRIDLAIGIVKKEAMEDILKASVEMGIRNIFLVRSQHSQGQLENQERLKKLLVSSLEQSNNAYLPQILTLDSLEKVPFDQYKHIITLSLQTGVELKELDLNSCLMLVGPEGGFSIEEENFLQQKQSHFLKLPVPILRAKTAVVVGVGFLLAKSQKLP